MWRKPTRLPRPWDSPGKNTGVGCHFLLQCMKVKNESEVTQSCLTQRPHELQPTKLLQPWDFPGKSTGVGCHSLLRLREEQVWIEGQSSKTIMQWGRERARLWGQSKVYMNKWGIRRRKNNHDFLHYWKNFGFHYNWNEKPETLLKLQGLGTELIQSDFPIGRTTLATITRKNIRSREKKHARVRRPVQ